MRAKDLGVVFILVMIIGLFTTAGVFADGEYDVKDVQSGFFTPDSTYAQFIQAYGDFQPVTHDAAEAWQEVPASGYSRLIFNYIPERGCFYVMIFADGEYTNSVEMNPRQLYRTKADYYYTTAFVEPRSVTDWKGLQAALNAGGKVKLAEDITAGEGASFLTVPGGVAVTLDLNGHTLDRGLSGSAGRYSDGNVMSVKGDLTITDSGSNGAITGGYNKTDGITNSGGGALIVTGRLALRKGAIRNNRTTDQKNGGGGVYLRSGEFIMTGGAITGNQGDCGGGVLTDGGTFAMKGGAITGNSSWNGGGVCVRGGTFTMKNGEISGNVNGGSSDGGGVCVDGGTFTMDGGAITGNETRSSGGGVCLRKGEAKMTDGTISGNKAGLGGGVYVNTGRTFTMEGGTISDNNAEAFGGGVCLPISTLSMTGGKITGNTSKVGGGVAAVGSSQDRKSTVKLGGRVTIDGNKNDTGANNNVYFSTDYDKITLIGSITGSKIGVIMNKPGVFTSCSSVKASDYAGCFSSDSDYYIVQAEGDELALRLAVTHTVTFVDDQGATLKTEVVVEGHAATAPEPPAKQGYKFKGWDKDFSNVTADMTIKAEYDPVLITKLRFKTLTKSIPEGETLQLQVAVTPSNALNKTLAWVSSDESIAAVSDTGLVRGVKEGSAKITVTATDGSGVSVSRYITVTHKHVLSGTEAEAATCTENGNIAYWTCSKCGRYFSDAAGNTEVEDSKTVIEALGHNPGNPVKKNEVQATCTETGGYDLIATCTRCDKVISMRHEIVPPAGHRWNSWSETRPATEDADGERARTCSVCGTTETEAIPAREHTHNMKKVAEVPATCAQDGTKEHWECTKCGNCYADQKAAIPQTSDQMVIKATGNHTPGEVKKTDEILPTCTRAGSRSEVTYCSICGEEINRVTIAVDAIGHDWDEGKVTAEPTCAQEGRREFTCRNDSTHVKTEAIPALGHVFDDWKYLDETDHIRYCTKEKEYFEIEPHEWGEPIINDETHEIKMTCMSCGHEKVVKDAAAYLETVDQWLEEESGNYEKDSVDNIRALAEYLREMIKSGGPDIEINVTCMQLYEAIRDAVPKGDKEANALTAKGKTVTLKKKKLTKTRKISAKKAYRIGKHQGALSFQKVNTKGGKKITVSKKTGEIAVKKGLKKGKYTVKVKITAAGDIQHEAASKTVNVTIRVK